MATIKVENERFVVEFSALSAEGQPVHFRSIYAPDGEPIAIRQPDTRSSKERYQYQDEPRSTVRQGIYEALSLGGYLVFIDKLESESQVFVNWRTATSSSYRRVPLEAAFHEYGPRPYPKISELVFVAGRFFITWVTAGQADADLVLSRIDPETAVRHDTVVAAKMGLVTSISFSHIGSRGIVVCHRAMIGGEDARIDVCPVKL